MLRPISSSTFQSLPMSRPATVTLLATSCCKDQIQSSDSGLCASQQDGPSLPTEHHSGLHTSSTTSLCCHKPPCPSCQPCNCLSLVPTAELLHPLSPVVEWPCYPHKDGSLPAHLPPQLEDSPLHAVPRLLFGSSLIYCPISCIFLFSTSKLYLSWNGIVW